MSTEKERASAAARWRRIKDDPAFRAKRRARLAAKKAADPEWHERYKARLRAYYQRDPADRVAKVADWRKRNPGRRSGEHRKHRYLLNREDYDRMVAEQHGLCAICKQPPSGKPPMGVLHVDHDHETGDVRELLCHKCNKALGGFRDDPTLVMTAAFYLTKHRKVAEVG